MIPHRLRSSAVSISPWSILNKVPRSVLIGPLRTQHYSAPHVVAGPASAHQAPHGRQPLAQHQFAFYASALFAAPHGRLPRVKHYSACQVQHYSRLPLFACFRIVRQSVLGASRPRLGSARLPWGRRYVSANVFPQGRLALHTGGQLNQPGRSQATALGLSR